VPKSLRLDIRLTERLFRELQKITKIKKALNPPTISEIVTRGIILAIREREKLDKKALVSTEVNNGKVAGSARSTRRGSYPTAGNSVFRKISLIRCIIPST